MKHPGKAALGIAISVFFLWWALHDVSLAEVVHEIRSADPLLFFLAAVAATLGIPIRALRWKSLLHGSGSAAPLEPRMAATAIGFGANNVLPARVGELIRAVSLARLARIPLGSVFGSLVLERVFDAVVLLGFLFAAMASPSFPGEMGGGMDPRVAARWAAGATVLLGVLLFAAAAAPDAVLLLAAWFGDRLLPSRVRVPVHGALRSFVGGLGVLRSARLFVVALAWAAAQWLFLGFSFLLGFRAFGIDVPYVGALFLQSLTSLAVAVPSSPGFFGPFEAAARVGLGLWGVPSGRAVSFAIGFHLAGFVPVTLLGLFYFWKVGLRWSEVERQVEAVEEPDPEIAGLAGRNG
ncbi:MAG: flippase-like domain-containing protein [Gemmatimonadota bacterium]|nr:flippase-like domain-containing protein [Gemmatimonadota bacterium]